MASIEKCNSKPSHFEVFLATVADIFVNSKHSKTSQAITVLLRQIQKGPDK